MFQRIKKASKPALGWGASQKAYPDIYENNIKETQLGDKSTDDAL